MAGAVVVPRRYRCQQGGHSVINHPPAPPVPVVVALPAEIDLSNQDQACDLLEAAFASGAPVVIADFTGTTFCDCSSLRRLLAVQQRAASAAQLRLAIPPGSPVRRLADLTGTSRRQPVYPSPGAAAARTSPVPLPRSGHTSPDGGGHQPAPLTPPGLPRCST